jgi:hypothetical protein
MEVKRRVEGRGEVRAETDGDGTEEELIAVCSLRQSVWEPKYRLPNKLVPCYNSVEMSPS